MKTMQMPMSITMFFFNHFNVNVANVPVFIDTELDEYTNGQYQYDENRIVVKNANDYSVIVHETMHYLQFNNNLSFSIVCDKFIPTIDDYDLLEMQEDNKELNEAAEDMVAALEIFQYWNKSTEIDARIAEAIWAYEQENKLTAKVLNHVFMCGASKKMFYAIDALRDDIKAKKLLQKAYNMVCEKEGKEPIEW